MNLLKGIVLGFVYWLAVVLLIALGIRNDDVRLLGAAAILVLFFLVLWRRIWRRRRRKDSRRVPIPSAVRRHVYARDGYRCVYCGRSGRSLRLTIDHVHPVAYGGTNDIGNLVTACRACNLTKGARVMNDGDLRRYANERRSWAGRERRRGCLLRLGAAAIALTLMVGVLWLVLM